MLALADLGAAALLVGVFALSRHDSVSLPVVAVFLPIALLLAKLHGLYDRDQRSLRHLTVDELPNLFIWSVSATAVAVLLMVLVADDSVRLETAAFAFLVAAASAFVLRATMRLLWRLTAPPERTMIIGSGRVAEAVGHKLELFSDMHVEVVGRRDSCSVAELREAPQWLVDVDRVVVALPAIEEELIGELVSACRREQAKLSVIPPARGTMGTVVQMDRLGEIPLMGFHTWDISRSTLLLKRTLDVIVASAVLVLLSPLLLLIPLAILVDSRRPVFFVQVRAGVGGRPFRMYKFRTMVPDAEERLSNLISFDSLERPMFKLANDPRVTRVGRWLRRSSLDELPQLLNVIKDEMSLVGPRPEQFDLVERYEPDDRFRLAVKPGITGPMQVYGRGRLSFDERLAIERDYIENLSIGRDLRILSMTLRAVLSGSGAY